MYFKSNQIKLMKKKKKSKRKLIENISFVNIYVYRGFLNKKNVASSQFALFYYFLSYSAKLYKYEIYRAPQINS